MLPRKILSVQNMACETLGLLEQMFKDDHFEIENLNAQVEQLPSSLKTYDAVVILGGPLAVYDNIPHLRREQDLVLDAMNSDIPTLGICLGSQLIAQAAGGRVYKGKKKEIGWHDVYVTPASSNDVFRGVTEKTIKVFQWHGDTYDLPSNAKMLAYSDQYPQAFRIGSAVGLQFHLEVDRRMIESWMLEYSVEVQVENVDPSKILSRTSDIEQLVARCRLFYNNFSRILK